MCTTVQEALLKIIHEIEACGQANPTKLTVLKKWLARPERLSAFALWIAGQAVSRKGQKGGAAAALFQEARLLLAGLDRITAKLNRRTAQRLHERLRSFQDEYRNQRWGPVRIVHNRNLLLVEEALSICLWHIDSPSHGYKLAADYCRHYDFRYGHSLNGPSRARIEDIVRFMSAVEALEVKRKCP